MAKGPLIFTAYPLSSDFERSVKAALGPDSAVVTAAQLRSRGLKGLLKQLWAMRGDPIALPIEEVNSAALLPVLKLLAACTRSRSIQVVHPDLSISTVSRLRIAVDGFQFGAASIGCLWAAFRAKRELRRLLSLPRVAARPLRENGRVLYVKTNLWFGIKAGGSVGHIAGVVNGLMHFGHPVTFASAEPPVMIDDGVEICEVRPPAAFGLPYELNNYRFQRSFEAALRSGPTLQNTGMIYQRLSVANYLGVLLSRERNLPLIVEYNGSEVWVAKNWGRGMKFHRLAEMAEEAMLRHAHLVVTVSDVLRDELIERGIEAERIVSYPNCVDPRIFDPTRYEGRDTAALRKRLGIPDNAVVATFVGTFGQWHGAEKFAEAIAKLHQAEDGWLKASGLHFLFVGDGMTRPKVLETIGKAGAQSYCSFVGLVPQAEAPLYLAASDILVSPHVPNADGSRFFGSPTKLFEYMAMGKPIIASSLEQIGEVLQPGMDARNLSDAALAGSADAVALMARPGVVDDIVEGLRFLTTRSEWRTTLGQNARARALQKYTWDRHVFAILDSLSRQGRA